MAAIIGGETRVMTDIHEIISIFLSGRKHGISIPSIVFTLFEEDLKQFYIVNKKILMFLSYLRNYKVHMSTDKEKETKD